MAKKYITVQLEVDYWVDEDYDKEEYKYPEVIESVGPVHVETNDLSSAELRAVVDYLRHEQDASYDLMWDLKALLSEARDGKA